MKKVCKLVIASLVAANLVIFSAEGKEYGTAGCNYYFTDNVLPKSPNYTYYLAKGTPDEAVSAVQAAVKTWNDSNAKMKFNLKTTRKSFGTNDGLNTIGAVLTQSEFSKFESIAAIAVNVATIGTIYIDETDIILNGGYSFGVGYSQKFYDYQGIFTHELGHTWGLLDLYDTESRLKFSIASEVPTMYGAAEYDGKNCSLYMRSLEDGDKAGLISVMRVCGFK